MRMPQPTDERAEALQGNRQAGDEATVAQDKGEHRRANCFKNARRSQVLLNCISDGSDGPPADGDFSHADCRSTMPGGTWFYSSPAIAEFPKTFA